MPSGIMRALSSLVLVGCAACGTGSNQPDAQAPVDGAAPDAAGDRWYSFVTVERWSRDAVVHTMAATVTFSEGNDPALPRIWPIDDHCRYHEGLWMDTGELPPSHGVTHLAGTEQGEVAFQQDDNGSGYETPAALGPGWDAGSLLTVRADGAELPAFEVAATVPGVPLLTSHDLEHLAPEAMVIDRAAPLALTWDPVDGEVFALILQLDPVAIAPIHGIQCFFPGASGAAAIPVAALQLLVDPATVHHTNFYFSSAARVHADLDGVDLDLAVWNGRAVRVGIE